MNKKPEKPAKPKSLRTAAEAELARAPKPKPKPKPALPAGELLHELQVYQIELEMQNEQLRQAQVALEESRDSYVDLYEFAPVGYLTLTATGQIKEANLTCSMLLGMERNKLLRRRFSTFIAPQHRERWNHAFASALKRGEVRSCELMIENGDGKRFHAQLNCKCREEAGKPPVVRITLTDVSQLVMAEEAMREWRQFVECAHWGMVIGRVEDRVIKLANPEFARMHGYTLEELHGIKADKLYAPESRADLPKIAEILGSAGCYTFECVRLRKDGSNFPAVVDVSTIESADGEIIYVAGVTDITGRKRADELLRKSAKEIEDLYNNAPCGYHSLDKDGIIRRINDTELAWLGYTRDEVVGKMRWPDLITSAGQQCFLVDFPRLMKQGFVRDIEVEIIRKDGTMFNGLINATAIYDAGGDFVASRSTVIDITARKQMERQLRKLYTHLQTVREEEKAAIAREIHDDMGGTLTAIKMDVYFLAEELSAHNETTPYLEHIESMTQLIDNATHTMRRIITGLRPSILDDLGLLAALEWYATQFSKRTGIECQVNSVLGAGREKALDKVRSINLYRIFQEALTNVARHSGASCVEVEFHRSDKEILLSISDNGRGIPEQRAGEPMHYGMLGMTERAEQLGGTIKFCGSPGGGLSVTVNLPLFDNIKKEEA